ncbi:MAG: [LysW]-lysine hydrolase [Deinococcus sp.]|nr:[LysW]-lysine hydrolase [Deinococcus sp.]
MTDLELLQGAVSIYSPSGQEQAVAEFLAAEMARRGMRSGIDDAGNAVGEVGTGPRTLLLLGHIDTVPGFIPVELMNGQLYGRGAVDAKGPICAFIAAASRGAPPGLKVRVVGAVEEEAASSRGARHLVETYAQAPDYVIIGEPSGWEAITVGYKGRLLAHCQLRLPVAHTASGLPSAAERAVQLWNAVADYAKALNQGKKVFEQLGPSLRHIATSSDGLSEHLEMTIGCRLPPDCDSDALKALMASVDPDIQLSFESYDPPYRAEKNNALVRAFLKSIRAQGGQPAFKVKTGTSDMNVVGPAWRCPIVAYGPGDSSLDHTPQEHVAMAEYQQAIQVLSGVIAALG